MTVSIDNILAFMVISILLLTIGIQALKTVR